MTVAEQGGSFDEVPGPDDRLRALYDAIARHDGSPEPFNRLKAICHACVDVLDVTGAGVMLMADRMHQGTLYSTDERVQQLEELQNASAEGPCIDSYILGRPVLAADLGGKEAAMWPLLSGGSVKVGIAALFSFPLQIDDASIGALDLFRDTAGPLSGAEVDDARLLAAMATREILAMQSQGVPGALASQIGDLSGDRAAIEQATGMVAAQTDTTVVEAARRLRRAAQDEGRALAEMARDVVARTVRFT